MSRQKPVVQPRVIVVPHRPWRWSGRLVAPVAVIVAGSLALIVRATNPDWRGLMPEAQKRSRSLFAARAKGDPPAPVRPPAAPARVIAKAPDAPAPKVKAPDAWDDIRRDAEKAGADRAEADRIKEKAEEELAQTPPPPPRRRARVPNPAALAEARRRRAEFLARMQGQMDEQRAWMEREMRAHQEAQRRMFEEFARRSRGPIAPGMMPGFDRPLPGMDRFPGALPGRPIARADPGRDARDGDERSRMNRVLILRSGDLIWGR